jgi:hypothetical protein
MAFVRFARDSDVHVYPDARGGFACERCPVPGEQFRCATAAEMLTHLLTEHRAKGHRVPDEAIEELRNEVGIYGPVIEIMFSEDREFKAEINWRRDGVFQVWVFRKVPGDGEYEPEAYWSPVRREAVLADTLDRAKDLAGEALRSSG